MFGGDRTRRKGSWLTLLAERREPKKKNETGWKQRSHASFTLTHDKVSVPVSRIRQKPVKKV